MKKAEEYWKEDFTCETMIDFIRRIQADTINEVVKRCEYATDYDGEISVYDLEKIAAKMKEELK